MKVEVHLSFDGNCEKAMKTYQKVFNGENMKIMRYSDIPAAEGFSVGENQKNLVLHGEMTIGDTNFNFADTTEEYSPGNTISVALRVETVEKVKSFYEGLKEGATIHMDLGETFFIDMYVYFTDRFGVTWQFVAI